jgi:hypothetical protein
MLENSYAWASIGWSEKLISMKKQHELFVILMDVL